MKEYLITASTLYKGYWQDTRQRTVYTNGTASAWSHSYSQHQYSSNNKIRYELSHSESPVTGGTRVTEVEKRYRIAATFDLTGIDTTRVQSVKLRTIITARTNQSTMGYAVFTCTSDRPMYNVTEIGRSNIGYPATPYQHDVELSGLSDTGWYLLYNGIGVPYATYEELTFDTTKIVLVVTTDEEGGLTYKTSKVRLGAGTYTAYFPNGESHEMAILLEPTGSGDNNYYSLDERQKITFTIAAEHDVWVSTTSDQITNVMIAKGTDTTEEFVPYGESAATTYIETFVADEVEGYVPTTGINGHYEYDELNSEGTNTPGSEENPGWWVGCTENDDRNLLNPKQINTFTTDGIHDEYYLTANNCTVNKVEMLTKTKCKSVNGKDVPDENGTYYAEVWIEVPAANYTVTQADDETEGEFATCIKYSTMPDASEKINVRVTFTPQSTSTTFAVGRDRGYIEKCNIVTRFGYFNNNRFWFAGNPNHKNTDYMSGVDDPTYFPASGWTKVGSDMTAIQGYLHYGSELAVIKEDNNQDSTIYMRSAILTDDNNILFPVQQGAQGQGAISKYCLKTLKDEPLFLSKDGVFAIVGTATSNERTVPNRSYFIDKVLKPEVSADLVAEVYKDYYIIANPVTGHCWVADARYQDLPPGTNDRQRIYEWFPWDNVPARVIFATDDYLFFGTQDGRLCVFNTDWDNPKRWSDGAEFKDGSTIWHKWHPYDNGYEIHAHYVTKRDHLDALDFKKTMLNDGGVIILRPHEQSSAAITVTTDKGSWFVDQIFTDSHEPSVVIPIRHRFKNFDSISTRIENNAIREGLSIIGLQYRYVTTTNRR